MDSSSSSTSTSASSSSSSSPPLIHSDCIAPPPTPSPPDPVNRTNSSSASASASIVRNAWSQIVRGSTSTYPPLEELPNHLQENPSPSSVSSSSSVSSASSSSSSASSASSASSVSSPSPSLSSSSMSASSSSSPSLSSSLAPKLQQPSLPPQKLQPPLEAKNSPPVIALLPPEISLASSDTTCSPFASSPSPSSVGHDSLSLPLGSGQNSCDSSTALMLVDGSAIKSSVESKGSQSSSTSPLKPAWAKPVIENGTSPVMGALSWPALSDARNAKTPEHSKMAVAQKTVVPKETPSWINESQASSSKRISGNGTNSPNVRRHKDAPSNRIGSAAPNPLDSGRISAPQDTENEDRKAGEGMQGVLDHHQRVSNNNGSSSSGSNVNVNGNGNRSNVAGNRRNFTRDQGRGNHGWHSHGVRGYPNGRETNIAFQQQRVGPRNLPRHIFPYMNPNSAFVNAVGYQTIPGSMYYMHAPPPPPPPDNFLGPTYFGPPPPPLGVYMHVPEPTNLQSVLVKQIEYYFSVDNLCRDIYLRSNMDDQGFVPVSIIAKFNRVRNIAQNLNFILDALKTSSIVEVQGNQIRKRGDWAAWLIPYSQKSVGGSLDRDHNTWPSSHHAATVREENALLRTGSQVQNAGQGYSPQMLAHDIPGDGGGHGDADVRIYGGPTDAGGNTLPVDAILQGSDFSFSDASNNGHATSSFYKETDIHLEDKSDLQAVKIYGVE